MNIDALLTQSWRLTWRHRFLWVLGLFLSSGGGVSIPNVPSVPSVPGGPGGPNRGGPPPLPSNPDGSGEAFGRWVGQNLGLIIAIVAVLVLLGLALLVVSFIAQGGMAYATAQLGQGQPVAAGVAWRAGLRLFWRYVGLWLLSIAIVLAVLLAVGLVAGIMIALGAAAGDAPRVAIIVAGVLLALAALLLALPFFIGLSIAYALAQRAVAVEDAGPVVAFRTGLRLLRGNPGQVTLTWLVSAGVTIGAGIVTAIAVIVAALPLAGAGVAIYAAAGLSAGLIAYAVVAGLLFIAGLWLLSAIINTFMWNYWTLAYLALTGRTGSPPRAAA
jgi:hypothetical protein